jgi:hypothetical protein
VESFLSDLLRDHRRLVDFFSDIGDDVIESIMLDAIVPLAIEALWAFSGFNWVKGSSS